MAPSTPIGLPNFIWTARQPGVRVGSSPATVLYLEFENINGADKALLEVVNHDGKDDLTAPNSEARVEKKRDIEARLIPGSYVKGKVEPRYHPLIGPRSHLHRQARSFGSCARSVAPGHAVVRAFAGTAALADCDVSSRVNESEVVIEQPPLLLEHRIGRLQLTLPGAR